MTQWNKQWRYRASIIMAGMVAAGCARVHMNVVGVDNPVIMAGKPDKPFTVVHHFEESTKAFFLIFDLATIREPEIEKILTRQLKGVGGDAVINVQLYHEVSFVDGLVRFLAEPLFGMSSYKVSGDVIKFQ